MIKSEKYKTHQTKYKTETNRIKWERKQEGYTLVWIKKILNIKNDTTVIVKNTYIEGRK